MRAAAPGLRAPRAWPSGCSSAASGGDSSRTPSGSQLARGRAELAGPVRRRHSRQASPDLLPDGWDAAAERAGAGVRYRLTLVIRSRGGDRRRRRDAGRGRGRRLPRRPSRGTLPRLPGLAAGAEAPGRDHERPRALPGLHGIQPVDHVPFWSWGGWPETIERWKKEGYDPDKGDPANAVTGSVSSSATGSSRIRRSSTRCSRRTRSTSSTSTTKASS